MRALGLGTPAAFLDRLVGDHPSRPDEMARLAALLTSGESFFMRDAGQMRLVRDRLLPELLRSRQRERYLRLWSAACAGGEEAYSLAILLNELPHPGGDWRIEVYGTDLDRSALARAAAGVYGDWSLRGCDPAFRTRYFDPQGPRWVLKPALRAMVRFLPCDLIHDPLPDPARELVGMDLILCRNLFIYLEPEAVLGVAQRLARCLRANGLLVTGHGELHGRCPELLAVEPHPESLVYRRTGPPASTHAPAPRPTPTITAPPARPGPPTPAAPRPAPPSGCRVPSPAAAPATGPATAPAGPRAADPDPLSAAWRLADAGRLSEALAHCRELLARDPLSPEPHLLAGVLAMELGDPAAAREDLRRAIYLAPDLIAAHVHLERLQSGAAEAQAARRTRARVGRLLAALPPDARVPFLGGHRAADLHADWVRDQGPAAP